MWLGQTFENPATIQIKKDGKQLWTISSFIHLDLVYPTTPAKALTRQQIYIRDVAVHKNDTYLCLN